MRDEATLSRQTDVSAGAVRCGRPFNSRCDWSGAAVGHAKREIHAIDVRADDRAPVDWPRDAVSSSPASSPGPEAMMHPSVSYRGCAVSRRRSQQSYAFAVLRRRSTTDSTGAVASGCHLRKDVHAATSPSVLECGAEQNPGCGSQLFARAVALFTAVPRRTASAPKPVPLSGMTRPRLLASRMHRTEVP